MKTQTNFKSCLTRLRGQMLNLGYHSVVTQPSRCGLHRTLTIILLLVCIGVGNVWGGKITLTQSSLGLTGSYTSGTEKTVDGVTFVYTDLMKNSDNIQAKASTGVIYNKTAMPGNITEIKVTHSGTARSTTVYYGTTAQPTTNSNTFSGSKTISVSGSNKYFKITRGSNAAYWTSIEITYADAVAYTITAQSNNNSYGTVSLSGTTITATPADCYQVVSGTGGYTVTSGTATVSHTGTSNTLTVTPSSNCVVQVNFEKKTVNTYIDEIQDNGEIEDCSTEAPSLSDKAAATSGTCAQQHYHFVGWVTAANKANPTDDNIIEAGETVAVNGTTYYAVWAKGSGGTNATVTFTTNDNDGTSDINSSISDQVSSSSGMSSYSGSKVYVGTYGLKIGTGSAIGTVTCTLSSAISTKTITVDAKKYGSNSTNISVKVNGSTTFGSAQAIPTSGGVLTFTNNTNVAISSVTVSTSSKQGYLKTITVGEPATYSDYITTCCTPLGQINGPIIFINVLWV